MPQKKRLELKSGFPLSGDYYFPQKTYLFVLKVELFYEKGYIVKGILPSGEFCYFSISSSISFINENLMGLGFVEKDKFFLLDYCLDPVLFVCINWVLKFCKHLKGNLNPFSFCLVLLNDKKKWSSQKVFFGRLVFFTFVFLEVLGYPPRLYEPLNQLFKENDHFFVICQSHSENFSDISIQEIIEVYQDLNTNLTFKQKQKLIQIQNEPISLIRQIRFIYWLIQQASFQAISPKVSTKTWSICADLLLYYAQSLSLWIP